MENLQILFLIFFLSITIQKDGENCGCGIKEYFLFTKSGNKSITYAETTMKFLYGDIINRKVDFNIDKRLLAIKAQLIKKNKTDPKILLQTYPYLNVTGLKTNVIIGNVFVQDVSYKELHFSSLDSYKKSQADQSTFCRKKKKSESKPIILKILGYLKKDNIQTNLDSYMKYIKNNYSFFINDMIQQVSNEVSSNSSSSECFEATIASSKVCKDNKIFLNKFQELSSKDCIGWQKTDKESFCKSFDGKLKVNSELFEFCRQPKITYHDFYCFNKAEIKKFTKRNGQYCGSWGLGPTNVRCTNKENRDFEGSLLFNRSLLKAMSNMPGLYNGIEQWEVPMRSAMTLFIFRDILDKCFSDLPEEREEEGIVIDCSTIYQYDYLKASLIYIGNLIALIYQFMIQYPLSQFSPKKKITMLNHLQSYPFENNQNSITDKIILFKDLRIDPQQFTERLQNLEPTIISYEGNPLYVEALNELKPKAKPSVEEYIKKFMQAFYNGKDSPEDCFYGYRPTAYQIQIKVKYFVDPNVNSSGSRKPIELRTASLYYFYIVIPQFSARGSDAIDLNTYSTQIIFRSEDIDEDNPPLKGKILSTVLIDNRKKLKSHLDQNTELLLTEDFLNTEPAILITDKQMNQTIVLQHNDAIKEMFSICASVQANINLSFFNRISNFGNSKAQYQPFPGDQTTNADQLCPQFNVIDIFEKPNDQPPVETEQFYFRWNCEEFLKYIEAFLENLQTKYSELQQDPDIQTQEYLFDLDVDDFLLLLDNYQMQCDNGEDQEDGPGFKTYGIVYVGSLRLIIRFYIIQINEEGNPETPLNGQVQFCYEIEYEIEFRMFKVYYECFDVPDIKDLKEVIEFEYNFLLYQHLMVRYYKRLKELKIMIVPVLIQDIYLFFEMYELTLLNNQKLIMRAGKIRGELKGYNLYYFQVPGYEHAYFQIIVTKQERYKVKIKSGFRYFEFEIETFFIRSKQSYAELEDDEFKINEFVKYKIYLDTFFETILYLSTQNEMKELVQFFNDNEDFAQINSLEIVRNYYTTDLVSFPILVSIVENYLILSGFMKIKIEDQQIAENIFKDKINFYFFQESVNEEIIKQDKEIFGDPELKWDQIQVDIIQESQDDKTVWIQQSLDQIQEKYQDNFFNKYILVYGLAEAQRKIQITIHALEHGLVNFLIIRFSCQFFVHEFNIPYSPLFQMTSTIKNIILDQKKNLLAFVIHFKNLDLSELDDKGDVSIGEINNFIMKVSQQDVCYEQQDSLFYYRLDSNKKHDKCTEKTSPIIMILKTNTITHGKKSFTLQVFEPQRYNQSLSYFDTVNQSNQSVKTTMISEYQILEDLSQKHKELIEKYLHTVFDRYKEGLFNKKSLLDMIEKEKESLNSRRKKLV